MKFESSAGGVVYRVADNEPEFLVVQHSGHHRWVLPKGWIEKGESKEQAALREVKEEAGVTGEITEFLGEFTIFYTEKESGEKVRKTNSFYLMSQVSGDPEKDHGWEVEDTVWLGAQEAVKRLAYPGEKKMVEKATLILSKKEGA